MQVFCDFDGTISIQDATDLILARFADREWQQIEEQWKQGAIGSAECMQRQIELIRASRDELNSALDTIEIDPSFRVFESFCRSHKIPLTVISDGVDYFIHRIFAHHRLPTIPVIANHLVIHGQNELTRYRLSLPFSEASCETAAGHCKCQHLGSAVEIRVYIGDGRSDFCVADKPEIVFAKGVLAEFCTRQNIAFVPYQDFFTVAHELQIRIAQLLHRPGGTLKGTIA